MDNLPDRKRCGFPLKDGSPCQGYPVKTAADGHCLFHTEDEAARRILAEGRLKGAKQPERRRDLSFKNLGIFRINSTNDLLLWLNRLNKYFFLGKIDKEETAIFLQISGGFAKVLETKEVSEELERLKNQLDELTIGNQDSGAKDLRAGFSEEESEEDADGPAED